MNKERDSLLLGISICSSMVRDTNSALLGVTGFNEVHIDISIAWSANPLFAAETSVPRPYLNSVVRKRAHVILPTTNCWTDQTSELCCGSWHETQRQKIRLTWCYVFTEVYWYRILFLLSEIGTCEQSCQIIYSKIVKGEISHSQFRNCLFLSQWLNPSPSVVNPIFSGPR